MANVMEIVITAKDKASAVMEEISDRGSKAASWLEENWLKVGAAGAALGASMEALARRQAPLTEQTRQLALSLGQTEGEVRALALSLSNVTLPLEDVLSLMEIARSQGLRTNEELENFVLMWDMVGDATGESAVQLAKSSSALRALGIQAGQEEQALAAFGFIQRETTMSISDFLMAIERMAPEMRKMGMTIDDSAALLGAMERELGLTSRTARTELIQAINLVDGDLSDLLVTLGLTEEQFNSYRAAVDASSNVIEENSAIHAESYTTMQKLQHRLSELTYEYGEAIAVVGDMSIALIALGPVIKATSALKGVYTAATTAATAATVKFAAATKALMLGPMGLVIIGVAAAVAAIWYLWKNWSEVEQLLQGLWQGFAGFFVGLWEGLTSSIDSILARWKSLFEAFSVGVQAVFSRLADSISALWEGLKDIIMLPFRIAVKGMNTTIEAMNRIKVDIPDWVPGIGGNTFGVNLPYIPMLDRGGVTTGPTVAMVGERRQEAILPLDPLKTGTRRIESLLEELIRRSDRPGSRGEVNLNIGTLVADETGLRALERKLRQYRIQEDTRRGVTL